MIQQHCHKCAIELVLGIPWATGNIFGWFEMREHIQLSSRMFDAGDLLDELLLLQRLDTLGHYRFWEVCTLLKMSDPDSW